MRRKRRMLGESLLPRWRFREDGVGGLGGGNTAAAAPVETPDVAPVNGGPDRDFDSMSSGTVADSTPDSPLAPAVANAGRQPAATRPTPADPNNAAGVLQTPAAPAAQDGWQSIREAAQAQGFQFDATVTDDRTALNFLMRQAAANRQADVYTQLGRQLAPQAAQIQQYLQQQSQPQAPATRQPWEAPEFDERWAGLVERDATSGLFVSKPGVPHDIAAKVNAFVEWKANYDRNPAGVINGMVEARAKTIAQTTFAEQFQAYQRDQTIGQIVAENGQWLYQVDAGGQRVRDYQGQFIPTPLGAAYIQQLQSVRHMGVVDPRQQDQLAKQLVRGQLALAAQQQAAAASGQATNPQTQAAMAQPNRNPLQAQPPTQRRNNPAATDPSDEGLSLMQRMMRELKAEGVTDQDIARSAGDDQ